LSGHGTGERGVFPAHPAQGQPSCNGRLMRGGAAGERSSLGHLIALRITGGLGNKEKHFELSSCAGNPLFMARELNATLASFSVLKAKFYLMEIFHSGPAELEHSLVLAWSASILSLMCLLFSMQDTSSVPRLLICPIAHPPGPPAPPHPTLVDRQ